MSSFASSLAAALPKPRYTGVDEDLPDHARSRGPRIVHVATAEAEGLIPTSLENAEQSLVTSIQQSQVTKFDPASSSLVQSKTRGNALAVQRDASGQINYGMLARQGHADSRIIHASFKDLIPLRHRADAGDISLDRPSEKVVEETRERTELALAKLVSGAMAAQRPKLIKGTNRPAPTYVRYTPVSQMGDGPKQERLVKIVNRQIDPMAPPKFKHKKIPRTANSPPPPVMRSPPRKLTAADQAAWRIPPPVSNWKNPKGYTVPLDKRLAADGRGLQDVTISEKFAHFHEALYMADRHAREEVRQRAQMQQKLAEKEKLDKEESLRRLAQKAREERQVGQLRGRRRSRSGSSQSSDSSSDRSISASSGSRYDSEDERGRGEARQERRRDNQRELRQQRMGTTRRARVMAQEAGRDVSDRIALGLAKPSQSDTMYDSRLFNRDSGLASGFNEDQPYDKPLFAAQDAVRSIYRPSINADEDGGDDTMDGIRKTDRFGVLGRAKAGFSGADIQEERDGPVQFHADDDPFNINQMIEDVQRDVAAQDGTKRYGLTSRDEKGSGRASKRARIAESDRSGGSD